MDQKPVKPDSTRWQGSFCIVSKAEEDVIQNSDQWTRLWLKINKPAPVVDWSQHIAVAIFLGTRPTGGYTVILKDAVMKNGVMIVPFLEKKPSGMAFEALTQPYAVRLYPKSGVAVRVEQETQKGTQRH